MLGELVCVAHEIEQRLADSRLVGMHVADILRTVDHDFVAVLGRHGAIVVITSSTSGAMANVSTCMSILPASIFDRSRMSLMSSSRWCAARSTRSSGSSSSARFQVARILMQHLRQADDRIQWRAQLVRHIRQELRLQLARLRQLLTLRLTLLEQPRILDGQYDCEASVCSSFTIEARIRLTLCGDHQCAGHALIAQQRYRNHGADSVVHPKDAYPLG